jgi:eukaryotic-like serine/threonine-protein kinase
MRCPSCGQEFVPVAGRCSQCGAAPDVLPALAQGTDPQAATVAGSDVATAAHPGPTSPSSWPSAPSASSAGPLHAGQAFGPRYHIIRALGAGGMGVVYQAWDAELGVAVALKVIRPEVLQDAESSREVERRFKRELVLARQVTHKHVVRIHDLGELGGIKYLTMPFVEGEDLAGVLRRDGRLPVPRVLAIARQVAAGLAAAHEVGVVHRDLKPENIMIAADGGALIMDFGISRSMSGTGTATALGAVIGTLEYMAPEQAQGQAVDQRADIYSFGLMLYDMLLGRGRLARGDNPMSEMMNRLTKAPEPMRALDPSLPEPLERIISRCLAPKPGERYATTDELLADLEALTPDGHRLPQAAPSSSPRTVLAAVAVLSVVALIAVAAWGWRAAGGPAPAAADPGPVSVVIATFENRANEPLFDGLIEQALAVGIEGASFVTTFPRRDALRLAEQIRPGAPLDEEGARLLARREAIDYVVAGAVAQEGSRYRMTIRVVDAQDRFVLDWQTEADAKERMLDAVGRAAARVRGALGDTSADPDRASDAETFTAASLDAAAAYARAQELQWAGRQEEAIEQYRRAVDLDPDLGRAYAGLAALYANRGRRAEAEQYYELAMSKIDRMTDREKYRTRGGYYLFTRNSAAAINVFEELVAKYPADTAGLTNLAVAHFYRRDMARALAEGEKAVAIYPRDIVRRSNHALFAMYAGDFEKARQQAAEALAISPVYVKAHVAQALSTLALGRPDDARAVYRTLAGVSAVGASFSVDGLADLALYEGKLGEAETLLAAGIEADEAEGRSDPAARKRIVLAGVRQARGDLRGAALEAVAAEKQTADESVMYRAGLIYLAAGQPERARAIARTLSDQLGTEPRIYGRLLEAERALAAGRARDAKDLFDEAQALADTWLGRYGLGRAYLELNQFPEAQDNLERCLRRIGEATAVFLDDVPSYRYLPPVYYYMGRAQEGNRSPAAARSFQTFLDIKQHGDEQGLVLDARRRLEGR